LIYRDVLFNDLPKITEFSVRLHYKKLQCSCDKDSGR
jgi:hypothetical protein